MLLTLAVLCVFPWMTSTGCEGNATPTTYTGVELLRDSLTGDLFPWLGPASLLLAVAIGFVARRIARAGPRFFASLGLALLVGFGAFVMLVNFESPVAADVVHRHIASYLGETVLAIIVVESLVRTVLAAREWHVDRLARAFERSPRSNTWILALSGSGGSGRCAR